VRAFVDLLVAAERKRALLHPGLIATTGQPYGEPVAQDAAQGTFVRLAILDVW
jgi:hypothetical protein